MAVRSGDHLWQRHEGYLRSDLPAATLRSDREAGVFILHVARWNLFVATHPPSPFSSSQQDAIHSVIDLVDSAWRHEFVTCVVVSALQIQPPGTVP
jgi:hypothetical protein